MGTLYFCCVSTRKNELTHPIFKCEKAQFNVEQNSLRKIKKENTPIKGYYMNKNGKIYDNFFVRV